MAGFERRLPTDPDEWVDTDEDGIGDEEDEDDDGDGILDEAEIREGSDPKDADSLPKESFELFIPGTTIGIDSWDLLGLMTGACVIVYIVAATMTRDGRYERYLEMIEQSKTTSELDAISRRLEHLQTFRLLGVRHVLRLEQSILGVQASIEVMQDASFDEDDEEPEPTLSPVE